MATMTRRTFITAASSAAALAALGSPTAAASQAAAAATRARQAAGGSASAIDPIDLVNPELRPVLEAILQAYGSPPPDSLFGLTAEQLLAASPDQLAVMRAALDQAQGTASAPASIADAVPVTERLVPGPAGAPDVRVFVVGALPGARRPAILHMHGGGFMVGAAQADVPRLQALALALDCVAVSVDYRLAPETPYPGSVEDIYMALKWLYDSAEELGVDRSRIAVRGESSGAGHAALLAIAARDRGEVPVLFQCLVYPMLDDRTGSSREPAPHIGTFVWTRELDRLGWAAFLGRLPGGDDVPVEAVPARVGNLAGLPPAFIGVGSIDLFVDEDVEYALRLNAAAVPTELVVVPGAYHGFDSIAPQASISRQFLLAQTNSLARAFGLQPLESLPVPIAVPMM